jgi:hypothetical protein
VRLPSWLIRLFAALAVGGPGCGASNQMLSAGQWR